MIDIDSRDLDSLKRDLQYEIESARSGLSARLSQAEDEIMDLRRQIADHKRFGGHSHDGDC